jgi:hypothetical protein
MNVTKLDAAQSQIATAIWLYFEDRDPISVHTLATAADEIIDRLCVARGLVSMRDNLMANIVPARRKEVADALHKVRNFFKHASSSKPNQVLADFSDDQNFFAILFAVHGLHLLGIEMRETKVFGGWIQVVEPKLLLNPPPWDFVAGVFGDIGKQPRSAQKQIGRDTLLFLGRDCSLL